MTEIKKLRALLAEARGLIDRNRLVLGEYETPREVAAIRKAIDAALAEPVGNDFRRGAEAMREAAAQEVCGYSVTVFNPFGERVRVNTDGLGGLGSIIRDLPVPEDKP